MDTELTIQQVAQMTGLSEHTLRYYERIGLILPVDRAVNGHRRYSAEDVDWINFVRRLRSAGMPIAAVQHYVDLQRQGSATLSKRLGLLKAHRDAVQQQVQELSKHLAMIELRSRTIPGWKTRMRMRARDGVQEIRIRDNKGE